MQEYVIYILTRGDSPVTDSDNKKYTVLVILAPSGCLACCDVVLSWTFCILTVTPTLALTDLQ